MTLRGLSALSGRLQPERCLHRRPWSAALGALTAAALTFAALLAPQAGAAVYWGDHGKVGAVNLDGSGANPGYYNPTYESPAAAPASCGLAVNSRYLYWLGSSSSLTGGAQISRVNLDGPTVAGPIVSGLSGACDLAAGESHIYWTNSQTESIGRANADGSEANGAFIGAVKRPCGVAVDAGHVYWASEVGIGRANLDGGEVERAFIPGFNLCGVAVTARYIFWSGYSGTIGRAGIDGGEAKERFISGTGGGAETYLAADAAHLYWTNSYSGGLTPSTIGRASLDGTEVNESWVTTDRTDELTGIAVDSRPSLSPLPLPSQPFQLGKVRHDRRTAAIVVDVRAWEGGELWVGSPEINWKVLEPASPAPTGSPALWRLKLWPGRRGGVARRIQAQLKRTGRAPIALRLFYREAGKTVIAKSKRLAFSRAR